MGTAATVVVATGIAFAPGESSGQAARTPGGAFQGAPVTPHAFDGDLRRLPTVEPWRPGDPIWEGPIRRRHRPPRLVPTMPEPHAGQRDPLLDVQARGALWLRAFSIPDLNFQGLGNPGVVPPDTVGEVGVNYYVQMTNHPAGSVLAIYDKEGSVVAGPTTLTSLWSAGGPCGSGGGDPIVLYDPLAGRWLLSEFAFSGNHLCVYISQTSDPVAGGWYNYDFTTPEFPDYPKYAVWPDAYYVSTNESSPGAYALDRSRMLAGLPATFQRFTAPILNGFFFQALTPSDFDGLSPPPTGSPNFFVRHVDDEAHDPGSNNPSVDFLEVWEFAVDFNSPANSTFALATTIAVTEFESELCGLESFECVPQPGTPQLLDPLREVVMWRLQYRNFGTHQTLVGTFVTDVDGGGADHHGLRWFELRRVGSGTWSLFQEGTYAPNADHRWLGSIAMDGSGNMALGYSVSGSSTFPGIRYVGRVVGDPLGTMGTEVTVVNGGASQTDAERWGDYSSMNVDPVDDCTFWYTNEYVPAGGIWTTRIARFRFSDPTCVDASPPVCGNNIRELSEECDGTDAAACPGNCLPVGEPGECQCSQESLVLGTKLQIKNKLPDDESKNKITFLSKDASITIGVPGSAEDPRCGAGNGGTITVSSSTSGQSFSQSLPCDNWRTIGKETSPKGYKYLDKELADGPCKRVIVKSERAQALCQGKGPSLLDYDLQEGQAQAPVSVVITTGASAKYCAEFGGALIHEGTDGKAFLSKGAEAPSGCP